MTSADLIDEMIDTKVQRAAMQEMEMRTQELLLSYEIVKDTKLRDRLPPDFKNDHQLVLKYFFQCRHGKKSVESYEVYQVKTPSADWQPAQSERVHLFSDFGRPSL